MWYFFTSWSGFLILTRLPLFSHPIILVLGLVSSSNWVIFTILSLQWHFLFWVAPQTGLTLIFGVGG